MSRILFAPEKWSDIPSGDIIARQLALSINDLCLEFHINEILAIGSLSSDLDLSRQIDVIGCGHHNNGRKHFLTDEMRLPLRNESIPCVLMAQMLDFHPYPHDVLREAARVVTEDGYLIICGFNPASLWGLYGYLGGFKRHHAWNARFLSRHRLEDWLSLLQFESCKVNHLFYRPPIRKASLRDRLSWMESLGRCTFKSLGGLYILIAVKRTIPLKPIFIDTKPVNQSIGSLAAGSIRCQHRDFSKDSV